MTALATLIARLEAATGPDWKLDAEIDRLASRGVIAAGTYVEYREAVNGGAEWRCRHEGQAWGSWWTVPSFTESLDAAV